MTPAFVRRRVTLSVAQRLLLALVPALLAVALVAGLAYWGEYGRAAPEVVVVGAAVLALTSLVVTWANARDIARRVARLAGADAARAATRAAGAPDELDRIELAVDRLGSALTVAEEERARTERAAEARLREHATMLSAAVRAAVAQLDEVRLPLHILLDARFGELNENQEELLASARQAADAMDAVLRQVGEVADADRGALPVQRELVQVNDVVRAVLPLTRAAAERRGARVELSLEPGLPRVAADRVRLAQALALLGEAAADATGAERPLRLATARDGRQVVLTLAPVPPADAADPRRHALLLARRLLEAQGAALADGDGLTIRVG